MNKIINIIFKDIKKDKSIYYSLIVASLISIVFGVMFITILKLEDKKILIDQISNYFENIKVSYKPDILNILIKNNIFGIIIWILGFSIIGIPLLIIILFYKCFTLSFTVTSIIYTFKLDGILLSFIYIFPSLILNLIFYFILIYYAIKLSTIFIDSLVNKKRITFIYIKKYIIVLLISLLFLSLSGMYEAYILPHLIKLIY